MQKERGDGTNDKGEKIKKIQNVFDQIDSILKQGLLYIGINFWFYPHGRLILLFSLFIFSSFFFFLMQEKGLFLLYVNLVEMLTRSFGLCT